MKLALLSVAEMGIKVVKYRDFVILSIFMYVYIKGNWGEVLAVIHEVWDCLTAFSSLPLSSSLFDTLIKAILEELWASAQWALTHEWAP